MNLEHIIIAITHASGRLSLLQFFTKLPAGMVSEAFAAARGFALAQDGLSWSRAAAPELIAIDVAQAAANPLFLELMGPVASWRIIAAADLPVPALNKAFRNARRDNGTAIVFDLAEARTIHMAHIRRARAAKLQKLDNEWQKAFGQNRQAEAATIEAARQTLRDIPQTFDLNQAQTAGALLALWPAELAEER